MIILFVILGSDNFTSFAFLRRSTVVYSSLFAGSDSNGESVKDGTTPRLLAFLSGVAFWLNGAGRLA